MLGLQGLAVKPLLGHALPGDNPITSSPNLILAHHLLQKILGLLLPLGDDLQLLTGFIILGQQISGSVGQSDVRLGDAVMEAVSKELGRGSGAIQRRNGKLLYMMPEVGFQLNEHRNQFLVTLHELPLESVAANQNGDVGSGIPGDGHVVLHLEHILVWDGVLPLAGLIRRSGLGLEDALPNIRDITDAVQVRQHEGMFLALEQLHGVDHLDPGALGELSPDEGFQLRPPIGSFPGLLAGHLICFLHPQLHRGLVAVDPADHGCVRTSDSLLSVFQPVSVGHILGGH